MRNHHLDAWQKVEDELLGNVCEVSRKIPWGFIGKRSNFVNLSVDQFLSSHTYYDTIVFHILSGEGEPIDRIITSLGLAFSRCLKLVILEHDPTSPDWASVGFMPSNLQKIREFLESKTNIHEISWGRNLLITGTTTPLYIPGLNDKYCAGHIRHKFACSNDCGINKEHLIYTHTSESPVSDKDIARLAKLKRITWVAGGMLCLETIPKLPNVEHHIIDSVLLQLVYLQYIIEPNQKMGSLYNLEKLRDIKTDAPLFMDQGTAKKWWRNTILNLPRPYPPIKSIKHTQLYEFSDPGHGIYVSTVGRKDWEHLTDDHLILTSIGGVRDTPHIIEPNA